MLMPMFHWLRTGDLSYLNRPDEKHQAGEAMTANVSTFIISPGVEKKPKYSEVRTFR
jgi:hypothetical protein